MSSNVMRDVRFHPWPCTSESMRSLVTALKRGAGWRTDIQNVNRGFCALRSGRATDVDANNLVAVKMDESALQRFDRRLVLRAAKRL
eukprot:392859-Prymnesium_polylepis.2